jgi:dTDP-4-dehydrorhamnose reductase
MKSKNSPRVIVLGATGMLGRTVYSYLLQKYPNGILGTARNKGGKFLFLDARDEKSVNKLFSENQLDFIVNCIGALDGSTHRELQLINTSFPKKLSKLSKQYGFKIVNISSDAVFDVNSGKVIEDSLPIPQDQYGESKLKGETTANTLNIRTSLLGFDPIEHKGLIEFVVKNKDNKITGYVNQKWSGATTLQVAKFIEWLIFKGKSTFLHNKSHVFHFAPIGPTTKYEILTTIAKILALNNVVRGKGTNVSRYLSTKYFDDLQLNRYTNNLQKAFADLVNFDKTYVQKIKQK